MSSPSNRLWTYVQLFRHHMQRRWHELPWLQVLALIWLILTYFHLSHLYDVQQVRSAAGRVAGALVRIESSQRGYLLTQNPAYLQDYQDYGKVMISRLDRLCEIMPQTADNKAICLKLRVLVARKLNEMQRTIDMTQENHLDQAILLVKTNEGYNYRYQIQQEIDSIHTDENSFFSIHK